VVNKPGLLEFYKRETLRAMREEQVDQTITKSVADLGNREIIVEIIVKFPSDAFWIAERLGSEFLTPKKSFDEILGVDGQAILDAYVARQIQQKASSAASPLIAPPELLDDDTSDQAEEK
jgi:hypothetical protein